MYNNDETELEPTSFDVEAEQKEQEKSLHRKRREFSKKKDQQRETDRFERAKRKNRHWQKHRPDIDGDEY